MVTEPEGRIDTTIRDDWGILSSSLRSDRNDTNRSDDASSSESELDDDDDDDDEWLPPRLTRRRVLNKSRNTIVLPELACANVEDMSVTITSESTRRDLLVLDDDTADATVPTLLSSSPPRGVETDRVTPEVTMLPTMSVDSTRVVDADTPDEVLVTEAVATGEPPPVAGVVMDASVCVVVDEEVTLDAFFICLLRRLLHAWQGQSCEQP